MINNILAVGDSFTYGEELPDRSLAWPFLVAQTLNSSINNMGIPSGGNTQIIRNVMESVLLGQCPDLVLIGWTSPGRIEFSDEEGTYDIWPGYKGRWIHHAHRNKLVDYISRYHDDEYIYKQYMRNIILLQTFLKFHNVKYIMMTVLGNEHYKNKFVYEFSELRDKIDSSHFVQPGTGMAEWTYGCKQGPNGHFLDEGHKIVANKVLDKIKEMGWA